MAALKGSPIQPFEWHSASLRKQAKLEGDMPIRVISITPSLQCEAFLHDAPDLKGDGETHIAISFLGWGPAGKGHNVFPTRNKRRNFYHATLTI